MLLLEAFCLARNLSDGRTLNSLKSWREIRGIGCYLLSSVKDVVMGSLQITILSIWTTRSCATSCCRRCRSMWDYGGPGVAGVFWKMKEG